MARRRVRRRKKPQKQLNRQTLVSMAAVTFVVLALLLVVSVKGLELKEKNAAYEEAKVQLEQQIAEEKERETEIDKYRDYVNSDEYMEKIAKERLGMVNDNEIIFYSGSGN